MADQYGVRLKKGKRYHYKGVVFEFGQPVAVSRELRDHLVSSGHFEDVNQEPTPVREPAPLTKPLPDPPPPEEKTPARRLRVRGQGVEV